MSLLQFETISEMKDWAVCGEPGDEVQFEVYSSKRGETVFEGTWDELLESRWAIIPLGSFDLAPREGFVMCFNLDDEDYEYEGEEDEEEEEDDEEEYEEDEEEEEED